MRGAADLVARLLLLQLVVAAVSDLLTAVFAPRLLLLDSVVVEATLGTAVGVAVAQAALAMLATYLLGRPLVPTLHAVARGDERVDAESLLAIYGLPARAATTHVAIALGVAGCTMVHALRPRTNDLYTQVALVLLYLTIVGAGALPLYVVMRTQVSRALELAPLASSREALAHLELGPQRLPRVGTRILVATAAPVAFVALGASLLVYAHARSFDTKARERSASDLALGVLERVHGSEGGRQEAIAAAEAQGYLAEVHPEPQPAALTHVTDEETTVTVPLEDGHAVLRFATTRLSPITGVYMLLAVVASALAALLGSRIGAILSHDVRLATGQVHATGVAEVMRGDRMVQQARFQSVRDLLRAIDDLGGVFREFAAAQRRAIGARESTERMRGLFLASMSHDLKAPLNAILGFAALLSRRELSEGQRENVTIVEQRGRELLGLIGIILDAARVEAGALVLEEEDAVFGDVLMSAVLDARESAGDARAQVVGEVQPGLPLARLDTARMVQALTSIIGTAMRFADEGTVVVRATLQQQHFHVDVETSGRTLPAAERARIFEAFHHEKARRHGSLGLGLSLARSIVELHRGRLEVEGSSAGGMVFRVRLPGGRGHHT